MEESTLSSNFRAFKASFNFHRGKRRKTWNEVIKSELKERNVNKEIAKYRNASKSFIRNRLTHASMESKG